jgi:translation elongation factor EF-Ts
LNPGAPGIPEEAREYADRGEKIEAIKITRERTGLGLKAAKDAVEQYLRNPNNESSSVRSGEFLGATGIPRAAIAALEKGQLIEAVRQQRAATGLGMKDSKEKLERFLQDYPIVDSRYRSASAARSRKLVGRAVLVLLGLVLVAAGYLYFSDKV